MKQYLNDCENPSAGLRGIELATVISENLNRGFVPVSTGAKNGDKPTIRWEPARYAQEVPGEFINLHGFILPKYIAPLSSTILRAQKFAAEEKKRQKRTEWGRHCKNNSET